MNHNNSLPQGRPGSQVLRHLFRRRAVPRLDAFPRGWTIPRIDGFPRRWSRYSDLGQHRFFRAETPARSSSSTVTAAPAGGIGIGTGLAVASASGQDRLHIVAVVAVRHGFAILNI